MYESIMLIATLIVLIMANTDINFDSIFDSSDIPIEFLLSCVGIVVLVFYIIYAFVMRKRRNKIKGGVFYEKDDEKNEDDKTKIITHHITTENDFSLSKLQAIDEYFDESRFLLFAKKIFISLQMAWSKFDFEIIKLIETKELYHEHENMLNEFKANNQINIIDRISVHSANIVSFKQMFKKEYIEVLLNASMIEYLMDETTKEIIHGNPEFKVNVTYLLTFERKKGLKTKKDIEKKRKNIDVSGKTCPNCGAPLDPKLYGWCEYCMGINKDENDWTLSEIEFFEE